MREAFQTITVPVFVAQAFTAAGVSSQDIDTLGFRAATIEVIRVGLAAAAGTTNPATVSLQHSDYAGTSTSGTFATICSDVTLARASSTTFGNYQRYEVDCKGLKRYLRVKITASTATGGESMTVLARMYRGESGPTVASGLVSNTNWGSNTITILAGGASTNTLA